MLLCILFGACHKDDCDRNVTAYLGGNFMRLNSKLYAEDFVINDDGSLTITGNGRDDTYFIPTPFLLRLDNQLEISWLKFWDLDQRNFYRKIALIRTNDDQYVLSTYSFPTNSSKSILSFARYSPLGYREWSTQIADPLKSLKSTGLIQLPNQDLMVISNLTEGTAGYSNQFNLSRIAADGDSIFSKNIDAVDFYTARQLVSFSNNNAFLALIEHNPGISNGMIDLFYFDHDGNSIWQKQLPNLDGLYPTSSNISYLDDNSFMLAYSSKEAGDPSTILIKMDIDGNEIWKKTYACKNFDVPLATIATQDGNYLLLSNTSNFGHGGFDVLLSKMDTEGNFIWEKSFGSKASDQASKIIERSNGNLVILGNTNEGNASDGNFDCFILETDAEGVPQF